LLDQENHFDWLQPYSCSSNGSPIEKMFGEELDYDDKILIIGCGSSRLPLDLYFDGFENITAIDWSANVISL